MIAANLFTICSGYSEAFHAATGRSIVPSRMSLLSSLVSLSVVGSVPEGGSVTYAQVLQAQTQDSVDGPSMHTTVIGDQIDFLIPQVNQHIAYVKNTVVPKIKSFSGEMDDALARLSARTPYEQFNIIQVREPSVLRDDGFMELVNQFADPSMPAPAALGSLPAQSYAELVNAMRVSDARVNAQIDGWLALKGESWLTDLWTSLFAVNNAAPTGEYKDLFDRGFVGVASLPSFSRMDVATALFLISRGLLDAPIENAGMSLSQWRETMDRISRYAAYQVKASTLALASTERSGTVILSVGRGGQIIEVYAPNYTKYLDQGGTVEDILGAALSGGARFDLTQLKSSSEDYQAVWKNFQVTNQSTLNAQAVSILRSTAISAFQMLAVSEGEQEQECLSQMGITLPGMVKSAQDYINGCSMDCLKDVDRLAIDLVAGIRYQYTPAKMFLEAMHDAEKAGCTSPREAAMHAGVMYVCDYLAGQMAVSSAA